VRSRETEVRVFDGDVESLSMAGVEGVGVRVISDHRQGFAWAGHSRRGRRRDAGRGSRQRRLRRARRVERLAVTVRLRDGDASTPRRVARVAPRRAAGRQGDAGDRARTGDARCRPARAGVESAGYGDTAVEAVVASSLGVAATSRRTMCSCSSFSIAGDADDTQTGYGFSVGRAFDDLDPRRGREHSRRTRRAIARCDEAAHAAAARRARSARDALAARHPGISARRRISAEEPIDVRPGAMASRSPRPGSRCAMTRRSPKHSGPPATTPREFRPDPSTSSPGACCSGTCTTPTPAAGPARPRRDRPCGAASSRRRASAPVPCTSSPVHSDPTRFSRPCRRPCTSSPWSGLQLGHQSRERRLLGRRRGAHGARRRARRAGA